MGKYGFDDAASAPVITLPTPKPKSEKPPPELVADAVRAGQQLGFVPREPVAQPASAMPETPTARERRGGRRKTEPQGKLLIAGPERVMEAFRLYCDERDIASYWAALEDLLERARKD